MSYLDYFISSPTIMNDTQTTKIISIYTHLLVIEEFVKKCFEVCFEVELIVRRRFVVKKRSRKFLLLFFVMVFYL